MTNFTRYLKDSQTAPSLYWLYEFPNGHNASVIPDPHYKDRPFRFEVESTDPDDATSGRLAINLTSEQVEAKLTKLLNLPTYED
jgi:hypothetical protein